VSIRHEFGDTKHRTVTYTLNAISRFWQYFHSTDPDEDFHASLAQAPVTIPSTRNQSSSRPRRRSAGTHEKARSGSSAPGPAGCCACHSRVRGSRPVKASAWPSSPRRRDSLSSTASADSYRPFVQLALARYQPDSLPDLHLSPVVRTDLVQLLPDRTLVIDKQAAQIRVSLTGVTPNPPNQVEVTLEQGRPGAVDLIAVDATAPDGVPAWWAVQTVVGDANGVVPPLPQPAGPGPWRVRVRETERLAGSGDATVPPELRERTVFLDVVTIPPAWYQA
jgi:hypothetical protein